MNRLQLAASTLLRNARVAQSSNFRTLLKYKSRKDVPAGLCSYVANGRQERTQTINASESFDAQQQRILSKSLQHVNELGWSVDALSAGARDAGYPSVAHGMLPNGAIDLVHFFMDDCQSRLRSSLDNRTTQLQSMSVPDRLKTGLKTRLEYLVPYRGNWAQAMALGAMPRNALPTFQRLAKLVDEIWYYAGDVSTDMSWYQKRAILLGIYASAELFYLTDTSANSEETWNFINRRIEETITLGNLPQNLQDVAGMTMSGIQSIFSASLSLAAPLGNQFIQNSPLAIFPNPIQTLGNQVSSSLMSSLANGFATASPFFSGNESNEGVSLNHHEL
uniref:Ubiquinone biosynthesis protein n=1 Tax=Albugo laibachii Nc14 TaxID=890382 RepID=F0WHA0_9STRA|nr:ubiquinone biosynthesis protein COQ9 putative [Albugo laibachii Nc14]|eukprot:CCA20616.1 ubiquinone biosynthesis protein COQ9 putative [Albugo laibachii Nc14]